jgi:hypothetical protein
VTTQVCPVSSTYYQGFIPTCSSNRWRIPGGHRATSSLRQSPEIINYLPNEAGIESGDKLFSFATYDRANKLPYTMNYTLDIQWQPRR